MKTASSTVWYQTVFLLYSHYLTACLTQRFLSALQYFIHPIPMLCLSFMSFHWCFLLYLLISSWQRVSLKANVKMYSPCPSFSFMACFSFDIRSMSSFMLLFLTNWPVKIVCLCPERKACWLAWLAATALGGDWSCDRFPELRPNRARCLRFSRRRGFCFFPHPFLDGRYV